MARIIHPLTHRRFVVRVRSTPVILPGRDFHCPRLNKGWGESFIHKQQLFRVELGLFNRVQVLPRKEGTFINPIASIPPPGAGSMNTYQGARIYSSSNDQICHPSRHSSILDLDLWCFHHPGAQTTSFLGPPYLSSLPRAHS
jgi:hypothetical protein